MSSLYFYSRCYARKSGRRVNPRFHLFVFVFGVKRIRRQGESKIFLYNPSGGKLFLIFWSIISYWAETHLESCQTWAMELSCENKQRLFNTLTISAKKLHHQCLFRLRMDLQLKGMSMCGCGCTASIWDLQQQTGVRWSSCGSIKI